MKKFLILIVLLIGTYLYAQDMVATWVSNDGSLAWSKPRPEGTYIQSGNVTLLFTACGINSKYYVYNTLDLKFAAYIAIDASELKILDVDRSIWYIYKFVKAEYVNSPNQSTYIEPSYSSPSTVKSPELCYTCHGSGRCHVCHGAGENRMYGQTTLCSACHTTGICYRCHGSGREN